MLEIAPLRAVLVAALPGGAESICSVRAADAWPSRAKAAGSGPKVCAAFIVPKQAKWAKVIAEAGIRSE